MSSRLAFVFYLFFHLVSSAVIVRRPGLADPTTTPLAVLPEALPSALLTPTTAVFTTTSDIATVINGKSTTVQTPIVSTSTGLAPIETTGLASASNTLFTPTTAVFTTTSDVATVISGKPTTVESTIVSTSIGLVPIATTPGQPTLAAASSKSKIPALAGGIVAAVILLIGGILLCVFLRKRRRALTAQRLGSTKEIPSPSDSKSVAIDSNRESWAPYINRLQGQEDGLTPSNTVSTRQLHISNQVDRAREKLAELEEMSTLLRSASNSSRENGRTQDAGTDHAIPRAAVSLHDEPVNTSSDPLEVQAQLERAIRQIEVMNSRIRDLEMQRRSSWALGLSDEPPPGYSE